MTLAALLLAAVAEAAAPPTRHWFVGTWVEQQQPGVRDLESCATWLPVTYRADGTYGQWELEGDWRLDGDRLTETPRSFNDTVEPEPDVIGVPIVSRIERVGPDELARTDPVNGQRFTMLRCPPVETSVAR